MTFHRDTDTGIGHTSALGDTAPSDDVIVAASGLSKRFEQRQVVSDLSFSVARGRAYGLLGPNGSGKTTTVRMLNGILSPDAGEVTLFGERVTARNADALRSRIGVQTDTSLYDTLSARENLRTWGALYGLSPKILDSRVDEVLQVMDLSTRADSLAGEFSKGMRQKLAIGRAVMHQPDLLFLDEPTAGLDPEASADLLTYLTQMIRSLNTTLIICTHQLHGLEALCDDVGILKSGELLRTGSVEGLLRERWPHHRYMLSVAGSAERAAQVVAAVTGHPPQVGDDGELEFSTSDTARVPELVSALVREEVGVQAIVPRTPTIEQLYFATLNEEVSP